jgi:hypothetical protein
MRVRVYISTVSIDRKCFSLFGLSVCCICYDLFWKCGLPFAGFVKERKVSVIHQGRGSGWNSGKSQGQVKDRSRVRIRDRYKTRVCVKARVKVSARGQSQGLCQDQG